MTRSPANRTQPFVLFFCAAALALLALSSPAKAEIKTKDIDYKQDGTPLRGVLAWDSSIQGKRPGVLVVHEWWGNNQHARNQAIRLARAGYVAFALDIFGKGKVTTHPQDAQKFTEEALKDSGVEQARFDAALAQLKQAPQVDPAKIAAIGYCFGGRVVLDMARLGEDLAAVATFHGSLASKIPPKKGIKPRILVMAGAADPMVGGDQVANFKKEMTDAGAHFEVITYPGAKHGFTNPDAEKMGVPGLAYNADADKESWAALLKMLGEVFGQTPK